VAVVLQALQHVFKTAGVQVQRRSAQRLAKIQHMHMAVDKTRANKSTGKILLLVSGL
jgi:hypothetical protein